MHVAAPFSLANDAMTDNRTPLYLLTKLIVSRVGATAKLCAPLGDGNRKVNVQHLNRVENKLETKEASSSP